MRTTRQISATDLMDVSLNVLKADGPFADEHCTKFKSLKVEPKLVARAWEQLIKDGFVFSQQQEHGPHHKTTRYYISLDGVIAIESCPFFLKGRPYKWKAVQNYLSLAWKVITVIAILLNAVIVLVFTYLTYIKP